MTHTQFKAVSNIGDMSISEIIRDNLVVFIDWALLETGSYFNINIDTSGTYGGDRSRLRPVSDPRYTDGKVWETYRTNIVWESGLSTSTQPISISGVFVDSVFNPNSGENFIINYPEGRVIFDIAIATTSTVQLEYSHKWVKVLAAKDISWFQEAQPRSFRVDDPNFLPGSGVWNPLSQTRVELPAIAVETLADREYEGYQLGGGSWVRTDVNFHILSEDDSTAYRLADILANQSEKTIYLFDTNRMASQDRFPLKYDGSKATNPLTYPDLVATTGDGGFRYTEDVANGKIRIYDTSARSNEKISQRLYHSTVKWRTEVIMSEI